MSCKSICCCECNKELVKGELITEILKGLKVTCEECLGFNSSSLLDVEAEVERIMRIIRRPGTYSAEEIIQAHKDLKKVITED
jgi:hypothetical protein